MLNITEEQEELLRTLVEVYSQGCRSEFILIRTMTAAYLMYSEGQKVPTNGGDTDFERLYEEGFIQLGRTRQGGLRGKPTALGIETIRKMNTDWITKFDQENFLAVYDVLLDIQKEINILADPIKIPLLPKIIRFSLLFPRDDVGTRDHYCELRTKATSFLEKKGIIKNYRPIETGHRWDTLLEVSAEPSEIHSLISAMKEDYNRRAAKEPLPAFQDNRQPKAKGGKARIFIGHGRTTEWRVLKDFVRDRLNLDHEEYTREAVAGYSRKERLKTMLYNVDFALLVMTAEDEHKDGTNHARENVIHEIGLFQGRLGFEKAIVLLEEGCSEFSNIEGLEQIRFQNGEIGTAFEQIRGVLEREGILPKPNAF